MNKILLRTKKQNQTKKPIIKKETIQEKPKLMKHDVIFDLDYLKSKLYSNTFYKDVPDYLNKFFFRYGNNIFYDNGETFELLSRDEARNKIPDQYKKSVSVIKNGVEKQSELSLKSYFGHELFLKTYETKLTIDYSKDYKYVDTHYIKGFEVNYNYLNMKKDLPRDYNKVIPLTEENKKGLKMFFDHIKNIICSNDEDEYQTVIKFFASSCVGHKLKFCLLWQSKEQTGKGTVLNYINDLLGKRMVKTSSVENVERYTKIFEGSSLVNLDELPVSGTSKTLQDAMKALITEPTFDCRAMHNQGYSQKNTFNFVITSNNNSVSLTQTNQIRYFVNTINEKYIGNKKYFDELNKYINKEEVKILVYQEFVKIYNEQVKPSNWIGNDLKPTQAGKIKRIEALPQFYKWIKDHYLLNGVGIDERCADFVLRYQESNRNDRTTPNKLARYLTDIGVEIKEIKRKDENGKYYRESRKYIISYDKLKTIYETKNWIDDLIDDLPDRDNEEQEDNDNPLDFGVEKKEEIDYKKLFEQSQKEIEELKKQLLKPTIEVKPIIEKVEIVETNKHIKTESIVEEEDLDELEKILNGYLK
jgi:hypothetical protein